MPGDLLVHWASKLQFDGGRTTTTAMVIPQHKPTIPLHRKRSCTTVTLGDGKEDVDAESELYFRAARSLGLYYGTGLPQTGLWEGFS